MKKKGYKRIRRLSRAERILKLLKKAKKMDIDPSSGKLFAYVYETGDSGLRKITKEANNMFYESNYLDFTVFRSAIFFEKEILKFVKEILNAPEDSVGTLTFGGTESIMLAVKAARDKFFSLGKTGKPELIVPITIHPAFLKSADYLGLDVKRVPVDSNGRVLVDELRKSITERTALVAVSAPNWPFGVVDPVEDIADITREYKIPLHVDACLGGFVLPFFERLGLPVRKFDFRVKGVTSISADIHKYGYAPKGSSVVLFRDKELKKFSMYVDTSSLGYVLVNQVVLSSRPIGPIASAFSTLEYFGQDGYMVLAKKILQARDKILDGMIKLGFYSVFPVESNILCLSSRVHDLINFVLNMKALGWHFHLQKAERQLNIPQTIHLAVSPIHVKRVEDFLSDAKKSLKIRWNIDLQRDLNDVISGIISGKIDPVIIPLLLDYLPSDLAEDMIKDTVISWFSG